LIFKAKRFRVAPKSLKSVELSGLFAENVDDHIDQVDEDPTKRVEALDVPGPVAGLP
jgi:hypothetical protein